jgi:hypothetical protein
VSPATRSAYGVGDRRSRYDTTRRTDIVPSVPAKRRGPAGIRWQVPSTGEQRVCGPRVPRHRRRRTVGHIGRARYVIGTSDRDRNRRWTRTDSLAQRLEDTRPRSAGGGVPDRWLPRRGRRRRPGSVGSARPRRLQWRREPRRLAVPSTTSPRWCPQPRRRRDSWQVLPGRRVPRAGPVPFVDRSRQQTSFGPSSLPLAQATSETEGRLDMFRIDMYT